ncbi:unnamed protein product, partial [Adineta steineri]
MSTTGSLEMTMKDSSTVIQDHNNEDDICPKPSRRSQLGLDWFNFFLSDVLNGVDSFLSAYLTGKGWGPQR